MSEWRVVHVEQVQRALDAARDAGYERGWGEALAEVRAWLESEGEAERMAEAYWKAREEFDCATTEQCMNAALAALAEQVALVAPSRVPGEGS